jgi:hypothetical protein
LSVKKRDIILIDYGESYWTLQKKALSTNTVTVKKAIPCLFVKKYPECSPLDMLVFCTNLKKCKQFEEHMVLPEYI